MAANLNTVAFQQKLHSTVNVVAQSAYEFGSAAEVLHLE